jgi:hypothetical protein
MALGTPDDGAMTQDPLISLLSAATRIACRQMTPEHLNTLHASVERASCLSARHGREGKVTAHAELFTMLGDLTGERDLALRVSSASGRRLQDLISCRSRPGLGMTSGEGPGVPVTGKPPGLSC